jgi:hypothetical protein
MAWTFEQIYDKSQSDGALLKRVSVAVWKAAQQITSESDNVTNHAARLAWAKSAVLDPDRFAPKFAIGVLLDETGGAANATDTQIFNTVVAYIGCFI